MYLNQQKMNRLIKFRAWIKADEVMVTQGDFYDYTMVCNGDGFGIVVNGENYLKDDEFELMQYTGLKDKNGVEIFEGDICSSNYFNGGKVVFWNSGWHFEFGPDYHHSFNTASHTFEVIGNIYQNTEITA